MIKGLRTTIYKVTDLARAKAWQASAFGNIIGLICNPHFDLKAGR